PACPRCRVPKISGWSTGRSKGCSDDFSLDGKMKGRSGWSGPSSFRSRIPPREDSGRSWKGGGHGEPASPACAPVMSRRPAMSIARMIQEHPDVAASGAYNEALGLAVRHAMHCAAICNSCADACSAEEMDMRQCIRTCLDCSDVCEATYRVATR